KKVLMIDLDGQSNLTFAILDEEKIRNCWNNKMSTYHFFSSLLEDPQVSINSCASERCSNIISTAGCLHVIPSSFDLFNFEEKVMEAYETGRKLI
ncbi:MAG: AAA family ATPase, partial [Bacillota bacterium]